MRVFRHSHIPQQASLCDFTFLDFKNLIDSEIGTLATVLESQSDEVEILHMVNVLMVKDSTSVPPVFPKQPT